MSDTPSKGGAPPPETGSRKAVTASSPMDFMADSLVFKTSTPAPSRTVRPSAPQELRTTFSPGANESDTIARNVARFLEDPENAPANSPPAPSTAEQYRQTYAPDLAAPRPAPAPMPVSEPVVAPEPAAQPSRHDPELSSPRHSRRKRFARVRWLLTPLALCAALGMIWAPTLLYVLKSKPVYESAWRIILPGEGVKTGIKIEEVGEAKTSAKSVFSSKDFDPRATYREIASSGIVSRNAAMIADADPATFDPPKIKTVPQTAILQFKIRRGSPELAQRHAFAFAAAFNARVESLRGAEQDAREALALGNIDGLREGVMTRRQTQLDRQLASGLMNADQFGALVLGADTLATELGEAQVELRALDLRFESLAAALDVSPEVAGWALILQGDRLFQALSEAYVLAETELARLRGAYGERHPDVITARVRRTGFLRDMEDRSRALIGEVPRQLLAILDLTLSPERSALFTKLVEAAAELEGQRARVAALDEANAEAQERVRNLAPEAAALADIARERQVAEAVFTAALADIDLSQTNPYASYPFFQLLDEPGLPTKPVAPKKKEAILGAIVATGFILLAFVALWYRNRRRRTRRKNASSSGRSA